MPKSKTQIENISAIAELDLIGYKYEPVGDNEIRLCCPVHDDHSPSVGLNTASNKWRCRSAGCGAHGDVITLMAYIYKVERSIMIIELAKRYDLDQIKEINPEIVEKYHAAIWGSGPLLTALYDRGVTDEDIRGARLGYHDGRITIPVYDVSRRIVNIRKYLPGAPGAQKMKNTPGYGEARLYQIHQLIKYDVSWICGGEMKALVAARLLNEFGVGAAAVSAGEGIWEERFTQYVKDKVIYICLDIDHGGRQGSVLIAEKIYHAAKEVWIIHLPLDPGKYPKGDVNDFIGGEGRTGRDLFDLQVSARRYVPASADTDGDRPVKSLRLEQAIDAENLGERISCEAVVAAMDTTPYIVPRIVGVSCTKDQVGCQWCPVKMTEVNPDTGFANMTIKGTAIGILEMVRAPKSAQNEAIRTAIKIPPCKVAKFHVYEYWNVVDIRVAPQLSLSTESSENIQPVPAYAVNCKMDLNSPYRLSGRVYPSPSTQQAILLFDEMTSAEDNLTNFKPNDHDLESLRLFQPPEWTVDGVQEKLDSIYADFEANVTRIFSRRDLHLVIDLCYHSVLLFKFDGQTTKGWTNGLILGDSSQGKSEASTRLRDHYSLGEKVEGKNTTVAGLLGGVQQLGNRWFVSWGAIPKNDRRLVMLEEVKGMPVEVLAALTDMRSSGVAEITKIESRRAHARTRLIAISNPRSDRTVAQYSFGVEAIKELIGALEDIRRFDVALIASAGQIDPKAINQLASNRPVRTHIYTSTLCRRLILWAWTRTPDQTQFELEATELILTGATDLCSRFSETLPLCDRGTMRHKIARLATALAVRTFSASMDLQSVYVRRCHVQYVIEFLDRTYSDPVFGYLDFSKAQIYANKVTDPGLIKKHLLATKYPADLVEHMLNNDEITATDIADWCELDRENAQMLLSLLVRKHAIYRVKRWYVKTSEFISLLKSLQASGSPQHLESTKDGQEF